MLVNPIATLALDADENANVVICNQWVVACLIMTMRKISMLLMLKK